MKLILKQCQVGDIIGLNEPCKYDMIVIKVNMSQAKRSL